MSVLRKNRAYIGRCSISHNAMFKLKVALLSFIEDMRATSQTIELLLYKKEPQIHYESGVVGEEKRGEIDSEVHRVDENFGEVSGDPVEIISRTNYSTDNIGVSTPLSLDKYFTRPVEIVNLTIPTATDVSNGYNLWEIVSSEPTVRSKFRNFAYFRGNLVVRVSISGSPFHYGRFLFSYQPYPAANTALTKSIANVGVNSSYRPLLLAYLSQAREKWYMDVRDNQPVEIKIPFISYKPVFKLFNTATSDTALGAGTALEDFDEAGTLYVYTLNQIKSASATPSDVSMQIYAWFEDVQLGCPTGSQMAITTESGEVDEREKGPVEVMSSKLALASSYLSTVPIIGKFASVSSIAFGAMASVSSVFGWSRPTIIDNPKYVKNNGFSNGANTVGAETNFRVTLDPKQELSVDPSLFGYSEDEMVINYITNVESYFTTFTWAPTDAIMTNNIFKCGVTPLMGTDVLIVPNTYVQPTAMAYAAIPFYYWRGDITFRIDIVASAYHRGKIAIVYEPNAKQYGIIDPDTDLNKQYMVIVDIQQTQSIELCVKWNFFRSWCELGGYDTTGQYHQDNPPNRSNYMNGYISIKPFTQLQSPDDSSVFVNAFCRSDNMKYNVLRSDNMPTKRVSLESGPVDPSNHFCAEPKGVSCVDLAPSTAEMTNIADFYFGEVPFSFRSLLKRYTRTEHVSASNVPAARQKLFCTLNIMPRILTLYSTVSSSTEPRNLFDYLRYAYLAYRGGIKKRLFVETNGTDNVHSYTKIQLENASSTLTIPSISMTTSQVDDSLPGLVTFMPHSNAGVEVELPFYTNNLFAFSSNSSSELAGNSGQFEDSFHRTYSIISSYASSPENIDVYEYSATGEDFSFYRFLGAPYFSY